MISYCSIKERDDWMELLHRQHTTEQGAHSEIPHINTVTSGVARNIWVLRQTFARRENFAH